MPNLNWSKLNHMQIGRYAEYYAKMEFTSYGYDVYTSEVDDHGVQLLPQGELRHPCFGDRVKAVERSRKPAGNRGNRIRIIAEIDRFQDTIPVAVRCEDAPDSGF